MSGTLIVLEGLDGSGKATQAQMLFEHLSKQGLSVQKITFPDYDSPSSALVRMYLSGEFGTDPDAVNAYAASSFYAVDRFASYKKHWERFFQEGGIIVADRYTSSNAVHQCSKLDQSEWDGFLDWLLQYEHHLLGIPAPDLVFYLSVDPQVSQELMRQRYKGDESRKDIHERNLNYLNRSRAAAEYCAGKLEWRRVECAEHGAMRSRESISAEIVAMVDEFLKN